MKNFEPLALRARDLVLTVTRGRERRNIIDIARLDIAPGSLVAVSGPSGSGKSTLLYLLSGLLRPTTGRVAWGTCDLARLGEGACDRWRRQNAGFVFQDFHLIEELRPLENVLAPAWFTGFSARHWRDRAEALLDRFGVPRDRAATALLSRGEQQRLAIARALLFDPGVIFADEPTASLDGKTGAEVSTALRDLAGEGGRSVITATHDPALLARADRVLHIERGQLREQSV